MKRLLLLVLALEACASFAETPSSSAMPPPAPSQSPTPTTSVTPTTPAPPQAGAGCACWRDTGCKWSEAPDRVFPPDNTAQTCTPTGAALVLCQHTDCKTQVHFHAGVPRCDYSASRQADCKLLYDGSRTCHYEAKVFCTCLCKKAGELLVNADVLGPMLVGASTCEQLEVACDGYTQNDYNAWMQNPNREIRDLSCPNGMYCRKGNYECEASTTPPTSSPRPTTPN